MIANLMKHSSCLIPDRLTLWFLACLTPDQSIFCVHRWPLTEFIFSLVPACPLSLNPSLRPPHEILSVADTSDQILVSKCVFECRLTF